MNYIIDHTIGMLILIAVAYLIWIQHRHINLLKVKIDLLKKQIAESDKYTNLKAMAVAHEALIVKGEL